MATDDWADWIKFAYDVQQARKSKSGTFQTVPQTPQQGELYDWAKKRVDALPDVTKDIYPFALQKAMASPKFDLDAFRSGKNGYTSPSLTAPDLKSIISGQTPDPTTPDKSGSTRPDGAGIPMGALHGIQSPDLVREEPGAFGSGGGPYEGESIYSYLTRNPGGDPRAFLPNQGQTQPRPSNMPAPPITGGDPHEYDALNSFYGSNGNGAGINLQNAEKFLQEHSSLLPKIGAFFGLTGLAIGKGAQLIVDWWAKHSTPPPTSGGGFIPGSISGTPPPLTPPPPSGGG